ncbi:glycosyltransferase [Microbacterium sp. NPDC079995]|uniref:glycosyltransferase n=1 Tax=unclassified Microbacterium TaxID=2609290 RepID=UPI00344B772F
MPTIPRVSIVIPVHNDEATIAGALESCLGQTLEEIEVICVDDASTDGTVDVITSYRERDARVRLITHESNSSAFQARRSGILAAAAAHVLFLDGDDELLPHAAERALALQSDSGADLVGFAIEVVSNAGGIVGGYQNRLKPKHRRLDGPELLEGLFPIDQPAQGQLWRYLFTTSTLRQAYGLLPQDLVLPRVNDLPLLFLVAALSERYVSMDDQLYRYFYGRGGSGQVVEDLEQAVFYAEAIRSIDSIAPAVRSIARDSADPAALLDAFESVRDSIIGYVCFYLIRHTRPDLLAEVIGHLYTRATPLDVVAASVRFYPDNVEVLKTAGTRIPLSTEPRKHIMLTTRTLTTGGVSGVLLTQAQVLAAAGHEVTIVARRYGSDTSVVPEGVSFIEMAAKGLPNRLREWADICASREIDVIIDHQVLYSRDWPEYALVARLMGISTIGWLHNFAARPILDQSGLIEHLTKNLPLLELTVTLSPLDVAFWKLRGLDDVAYVPNPPSPLLLESAGTSRPKPPPTTPLKLVWWGRLDEQTKQVTQLIEVAAQLKSLGVAFTLRVIGPDWGEWTAAKFNSAVERRRLSEYVEAVGERRGMDLINEIDSADAFLTTSIIEGYQLTIAEAQARGLPVFMYELPWLTLVQENAGIITAPQGDSAALAVAIADVADNPDMYSSLSRSSIEAADRAMSYDFAHLYSSAIGNSLPAAFSPEPTLDDARTLLDLTIFYAERNAGPRASSPAARKRSASRGRQKSASASRSSLVGAPKGSALTHRAWRAATPFGRMLLQLFPGMRPIAHRAKIRLMRLR